MSLLILTLSRMPIRNSARMATLTRVLVVFMVLLLLCTTAAVVAAQEPPLFGPAEPHYQRASHLLREGDVPAALTQIEKARALAPD